MTAGNTGNSQESSMFKGAHQFTINGGSFPIIQRDAYITHISNNVTVPHKFGMWFVINQQL